MRVALAGALLLLAGGCDRAAESDDAAGRALETAAHAAGMIADAGAPTGVFAAGDDRICVTRGDAGERYRIGVSVDYGAGQRCIARGSAAGGSAAGGARLAVDLGAGCRFDAGWDGDRLAFPATLPGGCARSCQGRATMDALYAERLSAAVGETARVRGADGRLLCAG